MNKTQLRQNLLQNRKPDKEKDRKILENLLSLKEFKEAGLVLTYVSTAQETDTHELIRKCFEAGKRVAVPVVDVHGITFYEINAFSDLSPGRFGIFEPAKTCKTVQIYENTFCVVPCLACDEKGFRLGYGKGYYDRFLAEFSGVSTALCYSCNIMQLPIEQHDVAVDMIITEGGVLYGR